MKKIWALVLAVALLVSVLCVGAIPAQAAVTGEFVDEIVPEFAVPEIVDFSAYGEDLMNTHRMACEQNPDLGATLLIKQAEPRDPGHTEYITYKMAKNIAGFEFQTVCCAGLGNPLEDITVFISKTGAEGSWATVKTQATRYTYDPDIYLGFDKAYWHQSTLMNAQKIPTGYKYLKIQFNPCTDEGDVPWNIAIDTVKIIMGSNVEIPVIPEDQTFLTYDELKDLPTTPSEPTTPSNPTTPSEPTTPPTQPSVPGDYIPGDVNNDGKVNVRDLGALQQHLNGWDVAINESAADVTGEGKLNVRDLGILQQYLNGWDVTLAPGGGTDPSEPITPPSEPTTPPTEPTTPPTEPTTPPTEPTTPPAPEVDMPGAGYDMDGKNRIFVQSSELITENGVQKAAFTFVNLSKDNGREWIIPETTKITYACYDASGAVLTTSTFVLGALEYRDVVTRTITLPEGTVRVAFTGHNLEYWTPWA